MRVLGLRAGDCPAAAPIGEGAAPTMPRWLFPPRFAFAAPASSAARWRCCWRASACAWRWWRRQPAAGAGRTCAPTRSTRPRRHLLESLRGWPDAAHATPVREMLVYGDEGGRVQFHAARQKVEALAWIVDVPALRAAAGRRGALPAAHRGRRRARAGAADGGLRRPRQRHARNAGRALRGHALSAARHRGAAAGRRAARRRRAPVVQRQGRSARAAAAGDDRQLGARVVGRSAARARACSRRRRTSSTRRCTTPATARSARCGSPANARPGRCSVPSPTAGPASSPTATPGRWRAMRRTRCIRSRARA